MRTPTGREIEQVSGGVVPGVYGAIVLGGRVASNPSVQSAAISIVRWTGAGFFGGGAGAAGYNWLQLDGRTFQSQLKTL